MAGFVPHSHSRTNRVSLIMKPLVFTVASTNSTVRQRNDAQVRITNSLEWVRLQLEARFSRCSIWIIFRVSSPSWRQYCSHESPGPASSSQLPTAWSSVQLDCERHSLALFQQTYFASVSTRLACGLGSRNKHSPVEIRCSERMMVRSPTAIGIAPVCTILPLLVQGASNVIPAATTR
jgi:hypothetical protein